MPDEIVKVDNAGVTIALGRFALSLGQRGELLKEIAAGMLVSVRQTFRDQGVPADSWAPLAASTLRNSKSKGSAGRKILILSGRLLNSIQATTDSAPGGNSVVIGSNLAYARVQQEGSGSESAQVEAHTRTFQREIQYTMRSVTGKDGNTYTVPAATRTGMRETVDKNGRKRKVRALLEGPRFQQSVDVSGHTRAQNIPARPYLVFRPEDGPRIVMQVTDFVGRAKAQAGLAGA